MATKIYEKFCANIDDRSFAVFRYFDRDEDGPICSVCEMHGDDVIDRCGPETTIESLARGLADKMAANADAVAQEQAAGL